MTLPLKKRLEKKGVWAERYPKTVKAKMFEQNAYQRLRRRRIARGDLIVRPRGKRTPSGDPHAVRAIICDGKEMTNANDV